MSLRRLLQRIHIVDLNLQLARLESLEQLIHVELELVAGLDIPKKRGTGDSDAFGREFPAIVNTGFKKTLTTAISSQENSR